MSLFKSKKENINIENKPAYKPLVVMGGKPLPTETKRIGLCSAAALNCGSNYIKPKEIYPILQLDKQEGVRNGVVNVHVMQHTNFDGLNNKDVFKRHKFSFSFYRMMILKESDSVIRYYFHFNESNEQVKEFNKFIEEFLPAYEEICRTDMGHGYIRMQIRDDRYPFDFIDSGNLLLKFDYADISGGPSHVLYFTGSNPDSIKDVFDDNKKDDDTPPYVTKRGADEVKQLYDHLRINEETKSIIKRKYGNEGIHEDVINKKFKEISFNQCANSNYYKKKKYYNEGIDAEQALDGAIAELPEDDRKIFNKDLVTIYDAGCVGQDQANPLIDMVGLDSVKKELDKLSYRIAYNKIQVERGVLSSNDITMHMCLLGNPGTGKTTVARYITAQLYSLGYIKHNEFLEVNAQHLKGAYSGHTSTIVKTILKAAKGRVLFIDEAYALYDGYENGYGQEAISVLLKEMEDNRNDLVIIFAGYKNEMEYFLSANEGLKSRINKYIEFPDYDAMDLIQIFSKFMRKLSFDITDEALFETYRIFQTACQSKNFSNARFVRNYIEKIKAEHAFNYYNRINSSMSRDEKNAILYTITIDDITKKIKDELLSMSM